MRVYLFVLCLVFFSSAMVLAATPELSVTANCTTAHIIWSAGQAAASTNIRIIADGNLTELDSPGDSGEIFFNFIPSLSDGDGLFVEISFDGNNVEMLYESPVNCEVETNSSSPVPRLCDDTRTNINLCEPLAIYPIYNEDGSIDLVAYEIHPETAEGDYAFDIPAYQLTHLPDVEEPCTITSSANGKAFAYLIPIVNGVMLQINYYPDHEGKMFIYQYPMFPMMPIIETIPPQYNFDHSPLPVFSPCFPETD